MRSGSARGRQPVDQARTGARRGGPQAQASSRRASPRLSEEQLAKLPELLAQGAPAHGFRGEVWTCERVAKVIHKEFNVSYHPAHM